MYFSTAYSHGSVQKGFFLSNVIQKEFSKELSFRTNISFNWEALDVNSVMLELIPCAHECKCKCECLHDLQSANGDSIRLRICFK